VADNRNRLGFGREITRDLAVGGSREWLCTNGIGGFASGTVAGPLTRRYHGLLVGALTPPVGRTLLVAKIDEIIEYAGIRVELAANRWADGTVAPEGYRHIESFSLDGTTPVWTFAVADALIEKRVWMEQGENTTRLRYAVLRATSPVALTLDAFVNYRDYHSTSRGDGWEMAVGPVEAGLRVTAFPGARPVMILAPGAHFQPMHVWYRGFGLAAEKERGLGWVDDNLLAGRFEVTLQAGDALTVICSCEAQPSLDGDAAWRRRRAHEAELLTAWRRTPVGSQPTPAWIEQLVLAADQFIVARPLMEDAGGQSVIAGYPWFADWGRDTMIALPGLLLVTGRHDIARRILTTFARFVDRGMLPNRFPDAGEAPEYNTVDAALWYFEAIRQYHEATGDLQLVKDLFPILEGIIAAHREGTRFGIGEDAADGLIRAGEPGVQLTWMDAKVGDWVVTPRIGKPVEINALWYNALRSMARFEQLLGGSGERWGSLADRVGASFARFWNEDAGYCFDVLDGPEGHESALRPNQIFAVSLPESPLAPERQRQVVESCGRHLLTSFGLRSLGPAEAGYRGRYEGGPAVRDGVYHQGTVWAWLLGPFALAHLRVHSDRAAAHALLAPMAHHLSDLTVGSIAEIFDGDAPFSPRGCPAQAWSVAEVLRAWVETA
jgi:predicted glycogen debranching enzyme